MDHFEYDHIRTSRRSCLCEGIYELDIDLHMLGVREVCICPLHMALILLAGPPLALGSQLYHPLLFEIWVQEAIDAFDLIVNTLRICGIGVSTSLS